MSNFVSNDSQNENLMAAQQRLKTFLLLAATAGLAGWILGMAGGAASASTFMEQNTDRYGGDYKVMTLKSDTASSCEAECSKDGKCRAWTYSRPGSEGPTAVCRLKLTVPHASSNPCCISGVRVGASLMGDGRH